MKEIEKVIGELKIGKADKIHQNVWKKVYSHFIQRLKCKTQMK